MPEIVSNIVRTEVKVIFDEAAIWQRSRHVRK